MQQTPLPSEAPFRTAAREADGGRFIYIAAPWAPAGGGMYKVADYLIQGQAAPTPADAAELRALDTRGPGSAASSLWVLFLAILKLIRGRLDGRLAGVHVNTAERMSLFRKGAIVAACRALGLPVVIHLHAQFRPFYRSMPRPFQRLTRWVFSLASGVVVIGGAARRFVMDELHVPANRIDIVINGVPGPAITQGPRPEPTVRHVLFVGRLCEPKGVTDLLEALARPGLDRGRVRVTLAGGGDVDGYRAKAAALGVADIVHFAGWCEQPQVDALLQEADLLVLPSHDEVLPLVVLESLGYGVPVLCTPVGELPAVLEDGRTAVFVPAKDVDALAAGLQRVLGDRALRTALAANGRALYEQQFSLQHFFASVARIHRKHFGIGGHWPDTQRAEVSR